MADKHSGITRREVAAGLVSAIPLAAQVAAPKPAPESLESGRDDVKRISDQLRKLKIPMDTEPAFSFRP